MPATPPFLDQFIKQQATRQPSEPQSTSSNAPVQLHLQSTWGFEAAPGDTSKGWWIGNTVQLFEGEPESANRVWEISTAFICPGNSTRTEQGGRVVPAFTGEQLEGAMRDLGFEAGRWLEGPQLTYSLHLSPGQSVDGDLAAQPMLDSFRELGFDAANL